MIGKTHGEIISWDMPAGLRIPQTKVVAALVNAGLDPNTCRDMHARHAFARACQTLQQARIIRKVDETATHMRFQFTREEKEGTADDAVLNYIAEVVLVLDKKTGTVTAPASYSGGGAMSIVAKAQAAIHAEAASRNVSDITRYVMTLCNANADIYAVRLAGGCYFVPDRFTPFIEKLEQFMAECGGSLRRFPIPAGTVHGDRSVSESVKSGLEYWIGRHMAAIEEFDLTTRDATLEAMVANIDATRFKLESYAEYLAENKATVEAKLEEARIALRKKIAELGRGTTAIPVEERIAGGGEWTDATGAAKIENFINEKTRAVDSLFDAFNEEPAGELAVA